MPPAPYHSTSKVWHAHKVGHVLAHEDFVECPGVEKEIETVMDQLKRRVYKKDGLRTAPLEYHLREADDHRHGIAVAFSVAYIEDLLSLDICAIVIPALLDRAQAKLKNDVEQMD